MGHLLASVNPAAAAAIKPRDVPPLTSLPRVGHILKFWPRPGEGRGGRAQFSIEVTAVNQDGTIDGLVKYDAQDFRDMRNVPHKSVVEYPAWDWLEPQGIEDSPTITVELPLDELRERIEMLEAKIGVCADLQDGYSARLTALERRLELQEQVNKPKRKYERRAGRRPGRPRMDGPVPTDE